MTLMSFGINALPTLQLVTPSDGRRYKYTGPHTAPAILGFLAKTLVRATTAETAAATAQWGGRGGGKPRAAGLLWAWPASGALHPLSYECSRYSDGALG